MPSNKPKVLKLPRVGPDNVATVIKEVRPTRGPRPLKPIRTPIREVAPKPRREAAKKVKGKKKVKDLAIIDDSLDVNERLTEKAVREMHRLGLQAEPGDTMEVTSFAAMLDELDKTFSDLEVKSWSTYTCLDTRRGLIKYGPTVIPRDSNAIGCTHVDVTQELPSMMFFATPQEKVAVGNETTHPSFIYGVKHQTLPPQCAHMQGHVFEVGLAYRFGKQMLWVACYVTVDPLTGRIQIPMQRSPKFVEIKKNKQKKNPDGTRERSTTVLQNQWQYPDLVRGLHFDNHEMCEDESKFANGIASMFGYYMGAWLRRKHYWRVSFRNNRRRLTFLIDKKDTKAFFRDRNLSAKTLTGQMKRIIHYVSAHDRLVKDLVVPVKEHLRGIRQFDWRGYQCAVTSPDFHRYDQDTFTAPAMDPDNLPVGEKTIGFENVSKFFANLEDKQRIDDLP